MHASNAEAAVIVASNTAFVFSFLLDALEYNEKETQSL
jgi:hypothetical protein